MRITALKIIDKAFSEKLDKGGAPYVNHLTRVANNFHPVSQEDLHIVALLHDLLEDCPQWSQERLAVHFPANIVAAVAALTRGEEESYTDFIFRLSANDLARRVKIVDLKDNMDLTRIKSPLTKQDLDRTKKYHKAFLFLSQDLTF